VSSIEIYGAGFLNKGAYMMLLSILQKLRPLLPGSRFVQLPSMSALYEERASLQLYQKLGHLRFNGLANAVGSVIPAEIRRHYGLVLDREIDVILDASGFAYGDQWGPQKTETLARNAQRWKRGRKKLIMLPQSFGPFTSRRLKTAMHSIAESARLIYARDTRSLQFLQDVVGGGSVLRLAPDFTALLEPVVTKESDAYRDRVCIIPNNRMVERGSSREKYVGLLSSCVKVVHETGCGVFFLIHAGDDDRRIAEEVNARCAMKSEIIHHGDPRVLKGIIGSSKAVISSRFHGAVSALSQGVPCFVTSWSHKYEMLLADYGCPDNIISVESSVDDVRKILSVLASARGIELMGVRIKERSLRVKEENEKMWMEIIAVINEGVK
jgi:polysaccharide pyruvyl transferase WcaK-like protein